MQATSDFPQRRPDTTTMTRAFELKAAYCLVCIFHTGAREKSLDDVTPEFTVCDCTDRPFRSSEFSREPKISKPVGTSQSDPSHRLVIEFRTWMVFTASDS
jgi:hypothetical protein